jgi:hypothetical protein
MSTGTAGLLLVIGMCVACASSRHSSRAEPRKPQPEAGSGIPARSNESSPSTVASSVPTETTTPFAAPPASSSSSAVHSTQAAPAVPKEAKAEDTSRPPSSCLPREPENVALVGVIERATFAGPPNHGSIAKGDAKEPCWLLVLDRPVCVEAKLNLSGDSEDKVYSGVRKIQLVFDDGQAYRKYRDLVGRRVQATGGIFGAETGHHHTEVLLSVNDLSRAPRSSSSGSVR